MSKIPLPPPPGFERRKKVFGKSKRYVYPFSDSQKGKWAAEIHEAFLADEEARWRKSKLRALAVREGKRAIRAERGNLKGLHKDKALKLGITLLSMHHPIFMQRNPLDQVFEHLRNRPRYFMKIDIYDAFGCVYPGFHPSFPEVVRHESKDLLDDRIFWSGWPFFHPEQKGLIQGARASSLIFEKACSATGLDKILRETARKHGLVVSRYVDDIIFSKPRWHGDVPFGDRIYETLRARIRDCGFRINFQKCRRSIDIRKEPIEFLGVSVFKNKIKASPAFFERLAALGYVTEGHYSWMEQIEELKRTLALSYKLRDGQ